MTNKINLHISTNDFTKCFQNMKESKAPSPFSHHVGHYIIAAQMLNPALRQTLCYITSTALLISSPLHWWRQCLQIMLDKGKGLQINCLRIIQLIETNLNFFLRHLRGHQLNHTAHHNRLYDDSQFTVIGQTCNSAVHKKVLFCKPQWLIMMPKQLLITYYWPYPLSHASTWS